MATQNKELLERLLNFLNNEIINKPENLWFVDELRKRLPSSTQQAPALDPTAIDKLDKIERYLALDYNLDSFKPTIDYSFIKDDYLRGCFEADCREMLRHRFGLRNHSINFGEFCRYAQMQIERLVNVYYLGKGVDMVERVNFIQKYNPKYTLPQDEDTGGPKYPENVEAISFAIKLWAYKNEHKLKSKLFNCLVRIASVRNTQSHGSSQPNADDAFYDEHYAKLKEYGLPLLPNGLVNWGELNDNTVLKNIYETTIKTTPDHKRYIELEWQKREPFDEVMSALSLMVVNLSKFIC